MKKSHQKLFIGSVFLITLIGCNNQIKINEVAQERSINFEESNYTSEASKTIGSIFDIQIKACKKASKAVFNYVEEPKLSRKAFGGLEFVDLGELLPEDLSLLTRTVDEGNRSATSTIISLEDELNLISEEFKEELLKITPDYSDAIKVEGINVSETGYLFGDDAEVPFDSIRGIMTTAILNEIANGKSIESVLSSIENDMNKIFHEETSSRAVIKKSTPLWPNSIVYYKWGAVTDFHKGLIEDAMKVWSDNTNVTFSEYESTGWNDFTLAIKVTGCVNFNTAKLDPGIAGNSYVGCIGGNQAFNLSETLSSSQYERTPLHELGHALGLEHEHTRYDRDDWIEVSEEQLKDSVNYGIIPKTISGWRWETRTVKVGSWRITLTYPAFWESAYSTQSDSFDFDSIMLYSGLTVKQDKIYQNGGLSRTRLNKVPSNNDFEMINKIY